MIICKTVTLSLTHEEASNSVYNPLDRPSKVYLTKYMFDVKLCFSTVRNFFSNDQGFQTECSTFSFKRTKFPPKCSIFHIEQSMIV